MTYVHGRGRTLGALIQKYCIFELEKSVECRSGRLHTFKVEKNGKNDFNFKNG